MHKVHSGASVQFVSVWEKKECANPKRRKTSTNDMSTCKASNRSNSPLVAPSTPTTPLTPSTVSAPLTPAGTSAPLTPTTQLPPLSSPAPQSNFVNSQSFNQMLCQQSPQPVLTQPGYSQMNFNPQTTLNGVNAQTDNTFNFNVGSDTSINLDIDTSFGEFMSQNEMSQLLANEQQQQPKQQQLQQQQQQPPPPPPQQQQQSAPTQNRPDFTRPGQGSYTPSGPNMHQEFLQNQPSTVQEYNTTDQHNYYSQNYEHDQNSQSQMNYQVIIFSRHG